MDNIKSCMNCKFYAFDPPRFDQPYPEFYCIKNHQCSITSQEEYEELSNEIQCVDFEYDKPDSAQ